MKNSILYIVGAVALLGGGAFLFLRNKKNKDKEKLALIEMQKLGAVPTTGASSTPKTEPVVKTFTDKELKEIQVLRDVILSDMQRKGTYRTSGSRDAVQSDINQNLEKLKVLGYTLDLNNNLVKV